MTVRAKFKLESYETREVIRKYEKAEDGTADYSKPITEETRTLKLLAVTDDSEENKAFWDATPAGSITLGTVNREAWEQFELGKEYYVDFTAADSAD